MALNSSGPISLGGTTVGQSIEKELGGNGTTQISLNDANVRALAGVASGAITMPTNFWGKSSGYAITISANTQNFNLLTAMQALGYVNGNAFSATVTINSGVYVWSNTTATAAFDTGAITGTGTISIINNGYIMGKGGDGVTSGTTSNPGGPAINIQKPITLTNNSYIGGGGGAGAVAGGGGAGGGVGGANTTTSGVGGGGGAVGASGGNGSGSGSGGGGRIMPGVGGTGSTMTSSTNQNSPGFGGGAGGGGFSQTYQGGQCTQGIVRFVYQGFGGGGGWGAAGGASRSGSQCNALRYFAGGAGGSAGNVGSDFTMGGGTAATYTTYTGGVGGKGIALNGNTVTYIVTGTIYGAVS